MMRRACSMWSTIVGAGMAGLLTLATSAFGQTPLPACPVGVPVVDTSGTFKPFHPLERLHVEPARLFDPDWDWRLGANTQQPGGYVGGEVRWYHGKSYGYVLTYNADGSGRIVVNDDGKVLIDKTYNKPGAPLHNGNALHLSVDSAAALRAGTKIRLAVDSINGQAVNTSVETAGTRQPSERSVVLASTSLTTGSTITGTILITFGGGILPKLTKLNATITAGRIACEDPRALRVERLVPQLLSMQTGANTTLTAMLSAAPPTSTVISLASTNPAVASVPPTLTVPAGTTQGSVVLNAGAAAGQATINATLGGVSASSVITVLDAPARIARLEPPSLVIASGATAESRALLDRVPAANTQVDLTVAPPTLALTPPNISVPAGQTEQPFSVTADQAGIGTLNGLTASSTAQSSLAVTDALPVVRELAPPTLSIAIGARGKVNLNLSAVQATDTTVPLMSSAPSIATVPAQVIIPAGRMSQTFVATGLAAGAAEVRASLNGPQRVMAVTVAPTIELIAIGPSYALSIEQGAAALVDVRLNAVAAVDTTVSLTSSHPSIELPAQVIIPAGENSAQVLVTGRATGTAVISGRTGASTLSRNASTVAIGAQLVAVTPSPLSLARGQGGTLQLRLDRASASPQTITIVSSSPTIASVSSTAVVPPGHFTVDVPVSALLAGSSTIRAELRSSSQEATVQVGAAALLGISVSKTTLSVATGAQDTISARAHFTDGSQQDITAQVGWSTSAPSIATVKQGVISGVAPGSATISAQYLDYVATTAVTVTGATVSLSLTGPPAITVGGIATYTISRPSATSSAVTVTLTASGAALSAPSSVTIAAGAASASFSVGGLAVGAGTVVASANGHGTASIVISVTALAGLSIDSISPTQGPVETTVVRIVGANFGANRADNTVTFAGCGTTRVNALVLSASATELTVRAPIGAVTGPVHVQTALGTATVRSSPYSSSKM